MPTSYTSPSYYRILALPSPLPLPHGTTAATTTTSYTDAQIRTAYRNALLLAHPDKSSSSSASTTRSTLSNGTGTSTSNGTSNKTNTYKYTIDDVREAYTALATQKGRQEYNSWLRRQKGLVGGSHDNNGDDAEGQTQGEEDFILGLEILDLEDFKEVAVVAPATGTSSIEEEQQTNNKKKQTNDSVEEEESSIEWVRPCRCGEDRGFRISEGELEDAVERGQKEVVVGCGGCSLWVRVGFDVEDCG